MTGNYYEPRESRFTDEELDAAEARIRERLDLPEDMEVDPWSIDEEAEEARKPDPDDARGRDWDRRNL